MKKVLISLMIAASIGLVSCGADDMDMNNNPNTNNPSSITGETPNTSDVPNTDGNSLNPDMNNSMEMGRSDINNLYTDLNNEIEKQKSNLNADEWEKFKADFNERLTTAKDTISDDYRDTTDDLQALFDKYDMAIRDKTDLTEVKVDDLKTRIEEKLNR